MDFINAYETHVWDVYGFLAYRTRDRQAAEDLTQETFERALRAWVRFDPARGDLRAWLLTIARHTYIDARRRRSVRPEEAAGDALAHLAGSEEPDEPSGPGPGLARALSHLSRREREAIALRFGGDLSIAEVAAVLGISLASAQQTLSRALRKLRSTLAGQQPRGNTGGRDRGP